MNSSQSRIRNFAAWIMRRPLISAVAAVCIIGGGYLLYANSKSANSETRYVTEIVSRQTIVSSVTGTGQMVASSQVDVKAKASGDIISVPVKAGAVVKQGQILATLDATDALKNVRDAETNLKSAQIALAKLQKPADALSVTQSQNSLEKANQDKVNAESQLVQAYDDGFNSVASTFLDAPTVMTGLQTMLLTSNPQLSTQFWNIDFYSNAISQYDTVRGKSFRQDAYDKYQLARKAFDKNLTDYKATDRSADRATVEKLITETYVTTKAIAEAVKSANNLIQLYKDQVAQQSLTPATLADTHLTTLNTYTGQMNSHLNSLLSLTNTIQNDKDAIDNAARSITENTQSFDKLKAGTDALDLQSAQLTVTQRQNALQDARNTLADYSVRAPFSGIVAKVPVNKGDSAGSGTTIATMVSAQQVAQVTLNEVDVAKIKTGEKATLSFDAIDSLTLTGKVFQIDTVGTVAQGVVTYTVQIALDSQDDRVKPGMSVTAAIVTDVAQDALSVSSSAIKSANGANYVEVFNPMLPNSNGSTGAVSATAPTRVTVQTGLSNDTDTVIVSGLNEGDQVVDRTIVAAKTTTSSAAPSLIGGGGIGGTRSGATTRTTGAARSN